MFLSRFYLLAFGMAVAAPSVSLAQPAPPPPMPEAARGLSTFGRDSTITQDVIVRADLKALKETLALRSEQTPVWIAFEDSATALLDTAKASPATPGPDRPQRGEFDLGARAENILRRAEEMRRVGEGLKTINGTWKALQASFDEPQKATAAILGERVLRELQGVAFGGHGPGRPGPGMERPTPSNGPRP